MVEALGINIQLSPERLAQCIADVRVGFMVAPHHHPAARAVTSPEPALLEEASRDKQVAELLGNRLDGNRFAVRNGDRGVLKQALIRLGWPAADEAGYAKGTRLEGAELTAELRS